MEKAQLKELSLLKVFGLMLVILGHSTHVYTGGWAYTSVMSSSFFRYLTIYIYSFHMPLFVFVSGALYYYVSITSKQYNNSYKFIAKKFKRLLIPYFIVSIFYMVPIRIIINYYRGEELFNIIVEDILLSKSSGHLWYLLMLFILFVVFHIMENTINKNNIFLNLMIFSLMYFISDKLPNILQISNVAHYIIFFYIGYIFQMNSYKIINEIREKKFLVFYLLFAQIILLIMPHFSKGYNSYFIVKVINRVSPLVNSTLGIIVCSIIVIYFINKNSKILNNRVFKVLDKYNFTIYLLHEPIIFVILSYLSFESISPFILVNLCFWVSLILSIVLSMLISKSKLLKLSFGQ